MSNWIFSNTIGLWLCLLSIQAGAEQVTGLADLADSQEDLRLLVRNNEDHCSLIKMDYKLVFNKYGPRPQTSNGTILTGGRITSWEGLYAQDGVKLRHDVSLNYDAGLSRRRIEVVDGEVLKATSEAGDQKQGAVANLEKYMRCMIPPLALGIYPFDDNRRLSDVLVPETARIHELTEYEGRPVAVVDVQLQERPRGWARFWIDRERGVFLKKESYGFTGM